MPISDWPEAERPREKLLALGPDALSDAELLAIFLRTGVPGQTAVELARSLITEFGSLRALEIKLTDEQLARLDEIWPGPGGPAPEAYAW